MKWPMDVHKYMSEITRKALRIIADAGVTNDSSDGEIKIVEQQLAANGIYKSVENATGRMRRALFTYFKAYNCLDSNCNLTPLGRAFIDNKLSIKEFSFHYIVNYRNADVENQYYPTELILTCLKKLEQISPAEAYITPDDFRRITECDSLAEIDETFINTTIANRSLPYNDVNERQIGFDVWQKMLCQAGILKDGQKNNVKTLEIQNPSLVEWLLDAYQKTLHHSPYELVSGVIQYIPLLSCSQSGDVTQFESEAAALAAFLFGGINEDTINKYVIRDKNNSLTSLLNCFSLKAEHKKFYGIFDGLEHLVGYRLKMTSDTSLKNLGKMLLDIPITHNDSPNDLPGKNIIFFGAPGTGKSHTLNEEAKKFSKEIERVTFYPNYTYSQFVGSYKPIMSLASDTGKEEIIYSYVPGPFMRQWIKAQNTTEPVLLIIEELNRANAPAVFGDMFQLLDRKDGISEYSVTTSEDLRKYLNSIITPANKDRKAWEKLPEGINIDNITLPSNLYIWATMNSADQGVFPLDTAFKRRWDYRYFSAFENAAIDDKEITLANGVFTWGAIRKAINLRLAYKGINEDKFLGPYFINESVFNDGGDNTSFIAAFKDKVIMYLFEDAARQCRTDVFKAPDGGKPIYSQIIADFEERGTEIFAFQIKSTPTGCKLQ